MLPLIILLLILAAKHGHQEPPKKIAPISQGEPPCIWVQGPNGLQEICPHKA